jgi:hypothetical protein
MKKIICLCLISFSAAFGQVSVTNSTAGLQAPLSTGTNPGVVSPDGVTVFNSGSGVLTVQKYPSDYAVPVTAGAAAFSSDVSNKVNYLLLTTNITSSSITTSGDIGHAGNLFHWIICQDATGGHTFVPPSAFMVGSDAMAAVMSGAVANTCAEQTYIWSTSLGKFISVNANIAETNAAYVNLPNVFTQPQKMPSITGTGAATLALGPSGVVGTGATGPVCGIGYACTSVAGTAQFTTGTGSLSPGNILVVTTGVTRASSPSCPVNVIGPTLTFLGESAISDATTVTISVKASLAVSTTYTVTWNCSGI